MHQVYAKNHLITEFTSSSRGLSGITLEIQKGETIPEIHVRNKTSNKELAVTKEVQDTTIHLSFEPERKSYNKQFVITIEAPTASKQKAVFVPYESDATKYPNNKVWQGNTEKQGSLGITQYEKPTIALLLVRWLTHSHQRPLWMGVALVVLGVIIGRNIKTDIQALKIATPAPWIWMLSIWIVIVAIYYPATKLFFYSDDVPILARVAMMTKQDPLLLFTPHQYQDADPRSAFGFDFWRPVSFAIYPFILHLLTPPSAWIYYFINITLFGIIGGLLFSIANTILRSKPAALLAVTFWTTNSAKLGVVYWWSSVQDILASLFAMAAIALYIAWRKSPKSYFLTLSLLTYLLGVFSKEYVIVTPIAIAGIEFLLHVQNKKQWSWKRVLVLLSPFVIAAGVFLILNTAVLGDPTLPPRKASNQTYALTFSPKSIFRNTVIYLSATAESKVWPHYSRIEDTLHTRLQLWEVKTSGPYYPGIVLGVLGITLPLLFWKQRSTFYIMSFGVGWWVLFMGPILLFANDWKTRWLMLATFGTGILAAEFLQRTLKKLPLSPFVFFGLSAVLIIYGYQNARSEDLNRFYKEQSNYTREAYNQLREQEKTVSEEKRIVLVGITPDQETSLNAYLFRLYAKNPQTDIMYTDSIPETSTPGDIIINMIGIAPYYPDSEK